VEKLWLKNYQEGVPYEIDANRHTSLIQLFDEACDKHKNQVAYVNMGSKLSFSDVNTLSMNFASYLQQLGLKKGARVAIMMPNILQYPIALFAILRAGFIVVNTNPLYTCDEITHQLNDSGAEAIVVLANFASTIDKALPNLSQLKHVVVTQLGDLFPVAKRLLINFVVNHIKKIVPAYCLPRAKSFRAALKIGAASPFSPIKCQPNDIAFLQYTGGTTGVSKGAKLTHGNMVANILQASVWLSPLSLDNRDIIITALPLYHIFSLTANCLTFFNAGAKNILITNPRDISQFIKDIKTSQFTAITGVNTLFIALLNHPKFIDVDFSKLKLALSGGMALQKSIAIKWSAITKSPILEAYGLTETSPAVSINPLYIKAYNGSIGLPLSSTDISIRDDDGKELNIGEQGELCVKGPQVMEGYWHQDDETSKIFWPDHFLRTGDIAKMDEKGFIYLVDRKKDLIIVSGFNVYPNEVEQVISMMPGVLEVGVVGTKTSSGLEQVKACIVRRDPALTAKEVIDHARQHLAAYKAPKIVEFYNELPKTNVGKILRRALK
jgi:long-chain acyl-CoA synthetase